MPSKEYNDKKLVQVYLNPVIKQKLKERAEKESRTLSQMAATILTFELKTK